MEYEIKSCGEKDTETIWDKLGETDFSVVPQELDEEEMLVFKSTDDQGNIIGGCVVSIDMWKNVEIDRLWVDERYRRRGLGSALIREAERAARERGCHCICNTYLFSFQISKALFEKHGYTLCGVIADWPKGYENFTLFKDLDGPQREIDPSAIAAETGFEIVPGSEEDGAFIQSALEAFNCSFAPRSHPYLDLDQKLVDAEGRMIAGCVAGVSGWDVLYIDAIWVDEPYRNQGVGSYLLGEIERRAKENGAYISMLGAGDWEDAFFRKQGYTASVTQDDFFGHRWYTMQKKL